MTPPDAPPEPPPPDDDDDGRRAEARHACWASAGCALLALGCALALRAGTLEGHLEALATVGAASGGLFSAAFAVFGGGWFLSRWLGGPGRAFAAFGFVLLLGGGALIQAGWPDPTGRVVTNLGWVVLVLGGIVLGLFPLAWVAGPLLSLLSWALNAGLDGLWERFVPLPPWQPLAPDPRERVELGARGRDRWGWWLDPAHWRLVIRQAPLGAPQVFGLAVFGFVPAGVFWRWWQDPDYWVRQVSATPEGALGALLFALTCLASLVILVLVFNSRPRELRLDLGPEGPLLFTTHWRLGAPRVVEIPRAELLGFEFVEDREGSRTLALARRGEPPLWLLAEVYLPPELREALPRLEAALLALARPAPADPEPPGPETGG